MRAHGSQRQLHADVPFKPMVRGRLVEVNGAPLDTSRYTDTRARRLAEREFNLSWTDALPPGNRVVQGRFWSTQARGAGAGMSLEEGIAQTLGVKVGDRLTFDAGGIRVTAPVTSLRKVDWDSFRVNFFALFAPGALDDLPATYIAAFRAPEGDTSWLSGLVQRYPNILSIDVGEILRQVQGIVDRVARAVEFVFLFTLAGGLLVLQAAIASTQDERKLDAAIVRTLGASQRAVAKRAGGRVPAARRACRACSALPARRRSAGRSPIACSIFRSPRIRSSGCTASSAARLP